MERSNVLYSQLNSDYGFRAKNIAPLGNGIINETYLVEEGKNKYVVQRLHPIFGLDLLKDIDVITHYLMDKNIVTPVIIKNTQGHLGSQTPEGIWRMMTYIPGSTLENGITQRLAYEGAQIIGNFHNALCSLDYRFQYSIPGFHDTPRIMDQLEHTLSSQHTSPKYATLNPLALEILDEYSKLPNTLETLPKRIIHGDLKLNNIRFDEKGVKGVCLLDLDTMGRMPIAIDLGDAARSWCNMGNEDDDQKAEFSLDIYQNMIEGYLANASFITDEEIDSLPDGLKYITLELSARFIVDAFEEAYFMLDQKTFKNLYEQNLQKARVQINLFRSIKAQEPDIRGKISALKLLR